MFSALERGLTNTGQQGLEVSGLVFLSAWAISESLLPPLAASRTDAFSCSGVTSG